MGVGKFGKDANSHPGLLDLEKTELVSAGRPVRIVNTFDRFSVADGQIHAKHAEEFPHPGSRRLWAR